MQLGVHLPHVGHLAGREAVEAVARRAEELGFHSLWVSDHIVIPRQISGQYLGSSSGRFPVGPDTPFLEPLMTLAFAAACTRDIRLGTSVLVLPMRHPVVVAKELATLDVLSGGRLIVGVGAGWLAEEFAALGVPLRGHGPRTDEYLEALRRLWTEDDPTLHGRYMRVEGIGFAPKPVQRPHPPIWVGGAAEGALRRAGRFGDAWHAPGLLPPQELAQRFRRVQEYARQTGRDPQAIALSVRLDTLGREEPQAALARLRELKEVGVSHALVGFPARTLEDSLALMERFARKVMPALA